MANTELLEQVMQHIEDHPEQHNQQYWIRKSWCGTTACFAGWACLLSGASTIWAGKQRGGNISALVRTDDGPRRVTKLAQTVLGISEDDARILFSCDNTREDLKLMVKELINGETLTGG